MAREMLTRLAVMSIHDQIRNRREKLYPSQEALANEVSRLEGLEKPLSWQTVQQWENGDSAPSRKRIKYVAKALRATVSELYEQAETSNVSSAPVRRSVPLIPWIRASHMRGATEPVPLGEADDWVDVYDTMPGEQSFALRVSGDSMTNPYGPGDNFPDGTIIVVDPGRAAQAGDYVVAKDPATQQATFKKLATDGGRWYLRPLNPSYPTVEIDAPAPHVIGKVIEAVYRRKL